MSSSSDNQAAKKNLERLLNLLRTHAYEEREIVLSSGRKSNFYIDCRKVVLTSEGHYLVGWLFYHLIQKLCPKIVAVGGMSIGADPLASATSLISHINANQNPVSQIKPIVLDAFYVRKEAKGHGTSQFVEGLSHLQTGAKVAILEDVITTGGSCLRAADRVEEMGFKPVHVFGIVDRCEGGRESIEKRFPLTTLFSKGDFKK